MILIPWFRRFAAGQFSLIILVVGILPGLLQAAPSILRGSLGVHDPSAMIPCNGRYYVFSTGFGISSKSSADKTYWVTGPPVFANSPVWTTNSVPGFAGTFWAPDVIYFNGQYHLYYAISTFGSQVSAIGLATNPTLDPSDPGYLWTDQGAVIQSSSSVTYNAIDPSVMFDASSNLWMSLGSFFGGIRMIQLDAATGKRSTTNLTVYSVATDNAASGDPIEASYLYTHGGFYYLFVNWGACCAGVDSTYNIRVGRSANITGPFFDRNNANMVFSGGTLFLKTTGKFIGPGQIGILNEGGVEYFGYHYYDGNANGAPTYDIEPLSWTPDDWPLFTNDWSAAYRFQRDARDDNGQYYGLIQNGAYVHNDPLLGNVLVFSGTNQYVNLPDGVANGCTFAAVFKWNGGLPWQRILDFGRNTNKYAFITPQAANGLPRFTITSSGSAGERTLDAPNPLPTNVWTHVAVTTDGARGILYVNGAPVATNTSMTLTPPDFAPTNTWFGRSPFTNDPYFNGQIGSIRIYGRALSANEIVAPQPVITSPSAGSYYRPGDTLQFTGTATDFADTPLSATGLTWTVEFRDAGVTNVVFGPLPGVGGGSYAIPATGVEATNGFHRIVLAAVDSLGRLATNFVDVLPNATSSNWAAFYPFNGDAADANGLFDGALQNGATTPADSIRGPVLNLNNSASEYVALPVGVGALRTFAAWVKWGGGNVWQRIFDFGSGTTSYAMLTAKANNGALRFEITPNGGSEARHVDAPSPLPVNVWTHVAVTLDGREAVMFVNGQAVAVNPSINLLPSDVAGSINYFGRSQFSADTNFNGQIDSVQINSQSLPIEQITAAGINLANNASALTLSWPAWTNGLVLGSSPNLGFGSAWVPVAGVLLPTNGINFLSLAPTNNQMFFRLQLP